MRRKGSGALKEEQRTNFFSTLLIKAMHIKKQRHNLATKVHRVKAVVFAAVMDGCESWTIKKAEH